MGQGWNGTCSKLNNEQKQHSVAPKSTAKFDDEN